MSYLMLILKIWLIRWKCA